jgi:hypothetical protein
MIEELCGIAFAAYLDLQDALEAGRPVADETTG